MTVKMALTKSGSDVLSETDPNNFIFDSELNTFKILAEGTIFSQTVSGSPHTFSLEHGLGYVPGFYGFAEFPDGKIALPSSEDYTVQLNVASGYGTFNMEADDTYLYFIFTKFSSNYNVNIKYYVFEIPVLS